MSKVVKDLSDRLLWEKYQSGDTSAFDVLFKRYHDPIFNYALKNLPDREIAEELTLDVMLRLWQKKGDLIIETDLRSYLFRSIKNAIYNYYRKKILSTIPIDLLTLQDTPVGGATDDKLKYVELEKIYHQKLNELSPQRQKIFRMSRERNMTYAQIAEETGLSVNTIENYMVITLRIL
ncbi:RNA polymerase sigma-70 factor, partial [Mucilaginibacter sp.]|uniref:RNA polymerase sigma-70 factor n=1 Tax=Mucilaginibacter sp. TaxID=1882438 RepID=UPI002ED5535C